MNILKALKPLLQRRNIIIAIYVLLFCVVIFVCLSANETHTKVSEPIVENTADTTEPVAPVTDTTAPIRTENVAQPKPPVSVSQNTVVEPQPPVNTDSQLTDSIPEPEPEPEPVLYDYTLPVAEGEAVDPGYFADAVFIGDSRTDGFRLYGELKEASYLCARSINVSNIYYERVIPASDGSYVTILDALAWNTYSKVYIMLGINEIGFTPEYFYECYSALIDTVRSIQPDAIIYLQTILPVSQQVDSSTIFNLRSINRFNEQIAVLAADKNIYFIDTYSALLSEDGYLNDKGSYDGIHLYTGGCQLWYDYLLTHTVDPTIYYN